MSKYKLFFLVPYISFNKSEKKLLKYPYISRGFILGDQVPNSHDFSDWLSIDVTRRNLVMITTGASRVKCILPFCGGWLISWVISQSPINIDEKIAAEGSARFLSLLPSTSRAPISRVSLVPYLSHTRISCVLPREMTRDELVVEVWWCRRAVNRGMQISQTVAF